MKIINDYKFDDEIFDGSVNKTLIYDCVKRQLANRRLGTNLCRNRALVSGTTAKVYRQKGTGRARHGDLRANIFVGGGKAFGPKPRTYDHKIPRGARIGALKSALNMKKNDKKLFVVDSFDKKITKTKEMQKNLESLSFNNGVIVVHEDDFSHVLRAARNIAHIRVLRAADLNVYDVMNHEGILFTKDALAKVQEGLKL